MENDPIFQLRDWMLELLLHNLPPDRTILTKGIGYTHMFTVETSQWTGYKYPGDSDT